MPAVEKSQHVPVNTQDELIHRAAHDTRTSGRMSISVMKTIGDVIDVDPTETPLRLDESVNPDLLDQLPAVDTNHQTHQNTITFRYGDYSIFCCSCGKISVYGDLEAHQAGEAQTPLDEDEHDSDSPGNAIHSLALPAVTSALASGSVLSVIEVGVATTAI